MARKDAKAEIPPFIILLCEPLVMDLSPFRPSKFTIPKRRLTSGKSTVFPSVRRVLR